MRKLILSIILSLTLLVSTASAEFFRDIIVTSPDGLWTDARAYTNLNTAITAVGATDREIVIASPQVVTNLTVPANVRLKFLRNGSITNSGYLNIQTTNISAENRQVFTGAGNIDFAGGSVIKSGWFSNIEAAFALTTNDTVTLIVSKPHTITASYSPGDDVILKWESPGNILSLNAGVEVGNLKNIEAGNYQLFAGVGDFDFLDSAVLKLSWFNSLHSALTWIESEEVTLIINGLFIIGQDDTISDNIHTIISAGSILTINFGITLTISGTFESSLSQVFDGTGNISFSGVIYGVYPEWFGAKGDGVTDDIDAIISAHNTGKIVNYNKGSIYYVEPSIGDTSKAIPIYEYQIINWNNCKIKCTNGAMAVYMIDCRTGIVDHHINNIIASNVIIYSERVGRTYGSAVDFEYFLFINGGYIMNCEFNNFSGSENLAARSIIKFDLNYTPAGVDAGVPDGIIVKNMYFLGSYGVSAIVLVDGSTSAATESRIGKIKIENLLLGCITTIDFDNRAQSTGRHGAIILNKASLHYSELSLVFGGVKTIQLLNNSKMLNTIIKTASNELQDQQSSGERGLIYSDATSYFEACSFESLRIYAIGVNFAPTYNYHMIDATLYNCDIITPYIYENAQDYGLVPADFIKVLSASYGNRIDHIEYFGLVNTTGDRSDISQTFITAPATSSIGSFTPPYSAEVKGLTVSPGNTVLFTIPADIIELRDTYDIRVVLSATACTVRVFASISIFLESETTTFTVTENILEITGTLFMDSATSKAIVATAAMKSVYRSTDSAGSYLAPLISGTYTVGNEVKVYVGIAGATDVEVLYASITGKRGKFSTEN